MERKIVSGIMLILLVLSMFSILSYIQPVRASETIYIRADGSIDPPTAPISTVDNITYTFTGDINDSIVIERDNIVVEGAGYIVEGTGSGNGITLSGRTNVTIKNMTIKAFNYGIYLNSSSNYNSISGNNITTNNGYGISDDGSSGNSISGNNITTNNGYGGGVFLCISSSYNIISGNNITNNYYGIALDYSSSYNIISGNDITANNVFGIYLGFSSSYNSISGNNITNNNYGIYLDSSSFNSIFHNNFINNAQQVYSTDSVNVWDDGYPSGGNYWSDYTGVDIKKGPTQDQSGSDNIGDTPYVIDTNNVDHYPLMNPYGSPTYSLTITATAGGTTNPVPGTYIYPQGQNVPVQAAPNIGYVFDHWELDGANVGSANPYEVLMDNNHTLHAVFAYAEIHDVAITNVTPSKTVVGQGYSLNVNVTAANQGTNAETFSVTAYYGNGTFTPEQWNVFWSMGDCNRDGYINIVDAEILANNFNWHGPPGSNPADLNSDGIVDIYDAIRLSNGFGKQIWKIFLSVIGTQTISNLAGGDSAAVMFVWNTTGVAYGNYTVTAVADPVVNETDTADNNCTCGLPVHVGVPGDISGPTQGVYDGTTNMRDVQYLILLFNTNPGSPNWKPNADINNDGTVNMRDIQIAILNFNKHE
jgi:parallel beta-helix repeat protein